MPSYLFAWSKSASGYYLSWLSHAHVLVNLLFIAFTDWCRFVLYPGLSVNGMMLRVKAKELSTNPEFKASLGWYNDWKRRHSISIRTKTTLAQRLPANMEDEIVIFHQFVVRARRRCEYLLSHIINMDETPMRFELPATRTLEFTGNRTVPITTCGADKQSFTVALAVKANGEKLPPKVIFKGVRQLRINLPPRMQVSHKKRLYGWRRYLSLRLFIFFRFVTYQITEHVLSSMYHIYANLTSLVGEFVYIWSPFDNFSAYVWV